VPDAGIERESLASLFGIESFDDFDTCIPGNGCGCVIAVIRHHHDPIPRRKLRLHTDERIPNPCGFIVGRDQYRGTRLGVGSDCALGQECEQALEPENRQQEREPTRQQPCDYKKD
jgi:hypothetical protein